MWLVRVAAVIVVSLLVGTLVVFVYPWLVYYGLIG